MSAVARSYWVLLGLCAIALVVSTGHDEASRYKDAAAELQFIGRLSANVDTIYAKASAYLRPVFGPPLLDALQQAASGAGAQVDKAAIGDFRFFDIDQGPLEISFTGNTSDLKLKIDKFLNSSAYIAKIPRIGAGTASLSSTLKQVLDDVDLHERIVVGFEFECNHANDQCRGELALRPKAPGSMIARREFFIDAQSVPLPLFPYSMLGFPDISGARVALSTSALMPLQGELAGKDVSATYTYLSTKIDEKEGSVKIFDLSFSGTAVYYALPIGIALSLGWLLMHLLELGRLSFSRAKLVAQGSEFFYARSANSAIIVMIMLIAPTASQLLIARVALGTDRWAFVFVAATATTSALLSVAILLQRRKLLNQG